jgi:DNA-binding transcriptional regulator YiaG
MLDKNQLQEKMQNMTVDELKRVQELCELAYTKKAALHLLRETFGEIKTACDIYDIDSTAFNLLPAVEKEAYTGSAKQRMTVPLPTPLDENKVINVMTRLRMAAGLTQQQLADKSGVSIRTLQKYECGDNDPANAQAKIVIALAEALGVEPKELI